MSQMTLQPEDIRSVSLIQACDNCRFVNRSPVDPKTLKRSYFCRRNPPTFFMTQIGPASSFPPVGPDMWCGEWQQILVN